MLFKCSCHAERANADGRMALAGHRAMVDDHRRIIQLLSDGGHGPWRWLESLATQEEPLGLGGTQAHLRQARFQQRHPIARQ
jgi:hypothetical protein